MHIQDEDQSLNMSHNTRIGCYKQSHYVQTDCPEYARSPKRIIPGSRIAYGHDGLGVHEGFRDEGVQFAGPFRLFGGEVLHLAGVAVQVVEFKPVGTIVVPRVEADEFPVASSHARPGMLPGDSPINHPARLCRRLRSGTRPMDTCISADGLELYFHSGRAGRYGQGDLHMTRRATRTSPWEVATNLGPKVDSSQNEFFPVVSRDGLDLYFNSSRPGRYGNYDLYVSTRATLNDPWGDPVNVGPDVNSPAMDAWASLSPDGLLLFFNSDRPVGVRPVGDGYVARRASRSAPSQSAVNLGPIVNATPWNEAEVSADGTTLYIICNPEDSMTYSTHKAPILPIVAFGADGKVDLDDLRLLIDNWDTDKTLYDVGS